MKLKFHSDAGHGWLAAPRSLIESLDLLCRVSPYSYHRGATVYLEEDCDAGLLLQALRERGIEHQIVELPQRRDVSPIRSYEHFSPRPPRRRLQENDIVELAGVRYQVHGYAGPRRGWIVRGTDDGLLYRMPARESARARLVNN